MRQVVRSPAKYEKEKEFPASDNLQIVKGDVTDVASLESAFEGVDNVIFTASGSGYWSAPSVDFQVKIELLYILDMLQKIPVLLMPLRLHHPAWWQRVAECWLPLGGLSLCRGHTSSSPSAVDL